MDAAVARYLNQNADRFVAELQELLRIPSVSARSGMPAAHVAGGGVGARAVPIVGQCRSEIVPTAGHPIVYAEWLEAARRPTVLVYGHYDVQPPDPLDEWTTPPFEPTVRDGSIYARGATDDKGQMFTHIKSVEAWLRNAGKLPVNLKFVIEGEEEVGSNNLDDFLDRPPRRLECDVAVISDTSQYAAGIPAITYGLRGIIACEVHRHGPEEGPAQRRLRRIGCQPGQRAGQDDRRTARRSGPHPDSGLLRRRVAADRRRTPGVRRAAVR